MALRSGQGQRKKYLTMDLSNLSTFVRNLRAVVSEFQFAKIGADTSVLQTLLQTPILFPFRIPQLYAADLEGQGRVETFRQGLDEDMVTLRQVVRASSKAPIA